MNFFRQLYQLSGNTRDRARIVIADNAEDAMQKITSELEKCYGPDGFTLRLDLAGPFTHESIAPFTGCGLSLLDVLLPLDRQQYLAHITEEKILREEERERERRKRSKEKRLRAVLNRSRDVGSRITLGHP
jgi:hypothetical protein